MIVVVIIIKISNRIATALLIESLLSSDVKFSSTFLFFIDYYTIKKIRKVSPDNIFFEGSFSGKEGKDRGGGIYIWRGHIHLGRF